jgi:hypothetical protein
MPGKKMKLRLDDLEVATFDTVAEGDERGTIQGNEDLPPTTEFCTWASYCPTRCQFTDCCY